MKKYLLTVFVILVFLSVNAQFTKLLDFDSATNGRNPFGSLYSDGTFLYGMTIAGGTNDLGTIFKLKPDGTGYSTLLNFAGAANGSNPHGSLISDGTFLYGMTYAGGINNYGLIFKIKPDGTAYSKILDFAGTTNGMNPYGSLIFDGTFLYGMTYAGGTRNLGTVFKIKPDGSGYSKMVDFFEVPDGAAPRGSLISDGTYLYGLTEWGGIHNLGTAFKIKSDGTGYSKLLDFAGDPDGGSPHGSLFSDGIFLYGTSYTGGTNNMGTIFQIKPDGTGYSKLLDFAGTANGSYPWGSLISDGIFLYGMTIDGGINDSGTVFKIKPDGTAYSKLLDFAGAPDGGYPFGSLISDGTFLYGMTRYGGTNTRGIIFKYALTTDISKSIALNNISISPNPFTNELSIKYEVLSTENADVILYDITGKEILRAVRAENLLPQPTEIKLNTTKIAAGFYLLRVGERNFKVVKGN